MQAGANDDRVLLLSLTRRDATTTAALLHEAGIRSAPCASFDRLLEALADGAAGILVPEETLTPASLDGLAAALRSHPPWSDLPILVLVRAGGTSASTREAVRTLGNVMLLERPLGLATLVSAVRTALRARRRQYQIRDHFDERLRIEESLRLAEQRKDEFLATLGHELRNPLAPLLSGMHLLRLGGLDATRSAHVLDIMERQITQLARLVDDLLEVSRITRGMIEMRQHPLDLVAVVRAAIDATRPVIDAAGHELVTTLPDTPLAIVGDRVRLTQVLTNLLTNAVKYTGGRGRIDVTARRDGDEAVVSVRDNGIGISPTHLAAVFEMFMQVDRSNRQAQGGLGIGLTLVRTLVESHGGRVEARSAGPGTGSEFLVWLPLLGQRVSADDVPTPLRPWPARRVLVVDDNRDAAETLSALLQALGATVSVAHSGRSALDQLDAFAPDTVLLDIGMPEMDGYEVARRIRARTGAGEVLLIALTGWGQERDQRLSKAAGFDHHMVKPPDLDKLRELLDDA